MTLSERRSPAAVVARLAVADWNDPDKPKSKRFVPEGADIHGWTPFVVAHPECFAADEGDEALRDLIAKAKG